jgi:isopropylmalate/homocitrate/citramalate synthase
MRDIEIIEVGPRDGLKNRSTNLCTEDKLSFIRRLYVAGARRIELASFVNPHRVHQMADAEAVIGVPESGRDSSQLASRSMSRASHERFVLPLTRSGWL